MIDDLGKGSKYMCASLYVADANGKVSHIEKLFVFKYHNFYLVIYSVLEDLNYIMLVEKL